MAINREEISSKWWTKQTVAMVTGANRGIGYQIVRHLAENGLTVVLTARDADRGLAATKTLHDQGLNNVLFHLLDIESPHSVSEFARWVMDNYGGLDILVNNAGVLGLVINNEAAIHGLQASVDIFNNPLFLEAFKTNYEMSKKCIEVNYYGTRRVTEALLQFLKPEGRIVNLSSEGGLLKVLNNDALREQLSDISKITEEFIDNMLQMFLDDMKMDKLDGKGWPSVYPHYSLSQIALNAYARLLAQKYSNRDQGKRLYVNNVNPGEVKTDMSFNMGSLTASEGAENCVMVALLPPGGPSGQFYFMKEPHSF